MYSRFWIILKSRIAFFQQTIEDLNYWLGEIRTHAPDGVCVALVGNKKDVTKKRNIPSSFLEKISSENNAMHFEASAKTGECVEVIFETLSKFCLLLKADSDLATCTSIFQFCRTAWICYDENKVERQPRCCCQTPRSITDNSPWKMLNKPDKFIWFNWLL